VNRNFDIAITGSGFGGSLIAMIARRLGRSVILLERGRHPRFAIGESSTPLANLLLEELARAYDLPEVLPLAKWGAWQRAYPHVGCGLKRGFTFYHHPWGKPFEDDAKRTNQLLVSASPRDEIADTHWFRADFDHLLARQAQAAGAEYLDETDLRGLALDGDGVTVSGRRCGEEFSVRAKFLIDATGPRGFVHRALALGELPFENLPRTEGLYSHFTNVSRCEGFLASHPPARTMNIPRDGTQPLGCSNAPLGGQRVSSLKAALRGEGSSAAVHPPAEKPPYPVDDAALHHVFDGGWIWVLRFNNGITSAGVAATERLARELCFEEGESAWDRLLEQLPSVREQFIAAKPEREFVHAPCLSFRSSTAAGTNWALLPSAAGFVDPLLSTGFALTLLGIRRLAQAIQEDWGTDRFQQRLDAYSQETLDELAAAERLVAALYASMGDFAVFTDLSRLYFAAVSFAETARRLGRAELAESFLLHQDPVYGPRLRDCCDLVLRAANAGGFSLGVKAELKRKVLEAIKPIDAAGLHDARRRNWHPVLADDLLQAAHKFGASVQDIERLLIRCGFSPPGSGDLAVPSALR
jgi:FADH2 O2-dependent halogenase